MLACHGHINVDGFATLSLQRLPLAFLKLILVEHLEFLCAFCHRGGLAHILGVEVAIDEARHVWRLHPLLHDGLPVDVSTPRMRLDSANLALGDAAAWVFVQHEFEEVC